MPNIATKQRHPIHSYFGIELVSAIFSEADSRWHLIVRAKFPTTMWGEAVLNGALISLFVYTTVLFFRRSRNFPRFFIFQFVATISMPIVALLWAAFTIALATGRPFVDFLSIDPKDGGQLIAALIGAVVWIPYIRKSRRVANTFTQ